MLGEPLEGSPAISVPSARRQAESRRWVTGKTIAVFRWTTPFGNLAILIELRTHGFASHPYGWFAFVVEHENATLGEGMANRPRWIGKPGPP
jgi:hypothetical protein